MSKEAWTINGERSEDVPEPWEVDMFDTSLSILVIDLGDSCVVKVEKGIFNASQLVFPSDNWVKGETQILHATFAHIRRQMGSTDEKPPVPRIERDRVSGVYAAAFAIYHETGSYSLHQRTYDHLSQIAGVTIPIYEPKQGQWTRLNTHDWTEARQRAGEMGYGIKTHSYEETICPVKVWRYTRTS